MLTIGCRRLGVLAICLITWVSTPAAFAQTLYDFNLPPQALADSLRAIGHQTSVNILFDPRSVEKLSAPAVHGQFSANQAVNRILAGTNLAAEQTEANTLLVEPKDKAGKAQAATTLNDPPDDSQKEAGKNSSQDFRVAQANQANAGPQVTSDSTPEKKKDEGLSEIVVTGTLLHNVAPITPVITITQADLINQGYTQLAQAIFDLPQNFQGAGTSPGSNPVSGAGGTGASYNQTYASGVNLRGLGGNATLVLLNGRRLAPTAFGDTVDISQIPVSAIDRVEILTDGASALYGSDAVAGVVNIITKRDYSGFEVGGRSTGISNGKTPDYGADMVGGYSWEGGGFVASGDYQKDNPLWARNRSFTELTNPWSLSPQDQAEHLYLSVHQQLADQLTFAMDTLFSHRDYEAQTPAFGALYVASGRVDQYSASPELDYAISPDWNAALIGQWSKEKDANFVTYTQEPNYDASYPIDYEVISIEPRVDGKLFTIPGGAVRVAVGGQAREEKIDFYQGFGAPGSQQLSGFESSRHVASAYGELMVPIIGRDNAMPFAQELRIDLSGRYDHYSDFGGTTNPKVGISWVPVHDLKVHGSFARSFQAPTLDELSPVTNQYAAVAPAADPNSPTGSSLALVDFSFGNPNLQPETAKTANVGLTYEPAAAPGLKFDASYFSIEFDNQIADLLTQGFCYSANLYCTLQNQAALGGLYQKNPSLAQVDAILNDPNYVLVNYAGGPYTPNQIKAIANVGVVNAASTRIRGLDLTPRYVGPETSYGHFRADFNASYYFTYRQKITSGSPSVALDNTVFNPLRFRAKANVGWENAGWGANARVNFANAYTNTFAAVCPSGCPISSWTTIDLGLSYQVRDALGASWLRGFRVAVIASNVFNRAPPFVSIGATGYGYDPVNANPLQRSFSVTFTKRWGAEDGK